MTPWKCFLDSPSYSYDLGESIEKDQKEDGFVRAEKEIKVWTGGRRKEEGKEDDASGSILIHRTGAVQVHASPFLRVVHHSWHMCITQNFRSESTDCIMQNNGLLLPNVLSLETLLQWSRFCFYPPFLSVTIMYF